MIGSHIVLSATSLLLAALSVSSCTASDTGSRDSSLPASLAGDTANPGLLLVANQRSATASIIDLSTGKVTHLEVGPAPHEAAISADGRWGVVAIYGARPTGKLVLIDMRSRLVDRTIDVGRFTDLHDVRFIPGDQRRVVVTSEGTQRVIEVDVATGTVLSELDTRAPGSHMLAIANDGRTVFTSNLGTASVSQLDLASGGFVRHVEVGPRPEAIAVTPDGREVWVGSNAAETIAIINTSSGAVTDSLPALGYSYRIAISPDGSRALISEPSADKVHLVDVGARQVLGRIAGFGSPRGVAIAADNRTAFMTLGPENSVMVIDLQSWVARARYDVGAAPDGVAWGPRP